MRVFEDAVHPRQSAAPVWATTTAESSFKMPRRSGELSVFLKETLPSLPDAIDAITMSVIDVPRRFAGVAAHEDRRNERYERSSDGWRRVS
jgi:hypothetical protein